MKDRRFLLSGFVLGSFFQVLALILMWTAGAVAQEDLATRNKRMPMTLSGYNPPAGAETLTNFPVMVVLIHFSRGRV